MHSLFARLKEYTHTSIATVPSIATEFSRNRKKHDSTARQWTQLYALPPKPLAQSADSQPISNKGKAKMVAPPPPQTSHDASSVAQVQRLSTLQRMNITVVDLDEDSDGVDNDPAVQTAVAPGKRKRNAVEHMEEPATRRRRSGGTNGASALPQRVPEVIVIDD